MNAAEQERYALETRAQALAFVSADAAVRRGEADRFEIGRIASSDVVDGSEAIHTGGDHAESAHSQLVRAGRFETQVDGKLSLKTHSDTTLLGGAMAETHLGPVLLLAGMSDSLVAGGGLRVSVVDLELAGLVGFEEKIGSAFADGALIEAFATHFEREYGPGNHVAGFAAFTGTVHMTAASGFRPLFKVATGVRNLTPGGGGGGGPEGPSAAPPEDRPPLPPPAGGGPGNGGLIGDTPDVAEIEPYAEFSLYSEIDPYSTIEESFYDEIPEVPRIAADDPDVPYVGPGAADQGSAPAPSLDSSHYEFDDASHYEFDDASHYEFDDASSHYEFESSQPAAEPYEVPVRGGADPQGRTEVSDSLRNLEGRGGERGADTADTLGNLRTAADELLGTAEDTAI